MKGISFTPENIKATIERRKTVARHTSGLKEINKEPDKWVYKGIDQQQMFWFQCNDPIYNIHLKPRYHAGEIVYIKETYCVLTNPYTGEKTKVYKADPLHFRDTLVWRSPLFMPAWAARYFLRILSVRPERLQEITEEDCLEEGIQLKASLVTGNLMSEPTYRDSYYAMLWDSINGKGDCALNKWVWCYEYALTEKEAL